MLDQLDGLERKGTEAMLDLHQFKMPKLKEGEYDRNSIRKTYLKQQCQIVVKNLEKNNFDAHYCDSVKEAKDLVLSLIPDHGVVGFGDSHTIFALELDEALEQKDCVAIPHTLSLIHI